MSRSKKARSGGSGTAGSRLQTVGLFVTLLIVAVLVGSLAAGLVGGRGNPSAGGVAADSAGADRARGPRPAGRVRVEVLNASGVPGLAAKGRTALRERGFDVVFVGNARGFEPDTSLVLDRVGRMELARSVADELQIPRVYARPDSNLFVDVTVVLGKDWTDAIQPDPHPEPEPTQ